MQFRFLFIILMCVCWGSMTIQTVEARQQSQVLTAAQALEEINLIEEVYERVHPGYERYRTTAYSGA